MRYELALMEIVTFSSQMDNEKYSFDHPVLTYERNNDHITRVCLVDRQTKTAYNIYTLEEKFKVLERDENSFLKAGQEIVLHQKYAIKKESIKMSINTAAEYLYRKHQLKKILKRK